MLLLNIMDPAAFTLISPIKNLKLSRHQRHIIWEQVLVLNLGRPNNLIRNKYTCNLTKYILYLGLGEI